MTKMDIQLNKQTSKQIKEIKLLTKQQTHDYVKCKLILWKV